MCSSLTLGFYISGECQTETLLENKLNQTEICHVDKTKCLQRTGLIRVFSPSFFFFFFFSPQNKFESRKTPIAGFTAELYLGHVEHFNSELLSTASYLVPQDLVMSP